MKKENPSIGGLIHGAEFHYLDHLAPLCALLKIPLIVTEKKIAEQARAFYPDLEVIHWSTKEIPDNLVSMFETIIYSTPRVLFDQVFYFSQVFHKKKIQTIWCPHGNSDKGRHTPFMEGLNEEEHLLTYGPRIETFLREKGITAQMTRLGNYRFVYYQKHADFYHRFFSPSSKKTLLYAPTWQDNEKNSSFQNIWTYFLNPPQDFLIWIKLHPNLYHQFPDEITELKQNSPSNVSFIEDFPPIYPILAQTDLYIGDMSSIGYDFLKFNKPMLLLKSSELDQVGTYLPPKHYSTLFDQCISLMDKPVSTESFYEETFGEDIPNLSIEKLFSSVTMRG